MRFPTSQRDANHIAVLPDLKTRVITVFEDIERMRQSTRRYDRRAAALRAFNAMPLSSWARNARSQSTSDRVACVGIPSWCRLG